MRNIRLDSSARKKNAKFKKYRNNSSNFDLKGHLKYLQDCLNAAIEAAKEKYHHKTVTKLNNTQKHSNWSLLKVLLNSKKIPIILHCFTKIAL